MGSYRLNGANLKFDPACKRQMSAWLVPQVGNAGLVKEYRQMDVEIDPPSKSFSRKILTCHDFGSSQASKGKVQPSWRDNLASTQTGLRRGLAAWDSKKTARVVYKYLLQLASKCKTVVIFVQSHFTVVIGWLGDSSDIHTIFSAVVPWYCTFNRERLFLARLQCSSKWQLQPWCRKWASLVLALTWAPARNRSCRALSWSELHRPHWRHSEPARSRYVARQAATTPRVVWGRQLTELRRRPSPRRTSWSTRRRMSRSRGRCLELSRLQGHFTLVRKSKGGRRLVTDPSLACSHSMEQRPRPSTAA